MTDTALIRRALRDCIDAIDPRDGPEQQAAWDLAIDALESLTPLRNPAQLDPGPGEYLAVVHIVRDYRTDADLIAPKRPTIKALTAQLVEELGAAFRENIVAGSYSVVSLSKVTPA